MSTTIMASSSSPPTSTLPPPPASSASITTLPDPPLSLLQPIPEPYRPDSQNTVPTLLSVSFNQDSSCFAAATDCGFRVYNAEPFREIYCRDFSYGGSVALVQLLFRSSLYALVGGGPNPHYPPNKVIIWDDSKLRCIGELAFRSDVLSVRLRRDRIVVVLMQKVSVYNFDDLSLLHQIETIENPKGLCEVSCVSSSFVLCCLAMQKGHIRVEHFSSRRTKFIRAHDSSIAAMALTLDGMAVATASNKGTLVRVFNTLDGTLLQEVRRGTDRAEIHSLAFSTNAQWLAVSSDRGTVHVFSLQVEPITRGANALATASQSHHSIQAPKSSLSLIKGMLPLPKYFNSEWSVAKFYLQEGCRYIVGFGFEKHTIIILGMDGSYYHCKFDPVAGGEMTLLSHHKFLKKNEPLQIP